MGPLADAAKVLVLNAGSSSLKFKLFEHGAGGALTAGLGGLIERIGDTANSALVAKGPSHDSAGQIQKWEEKVPMRDHVDALKTVVDFLKQNHSANIKQQVAAVGHRVVHGLDISRPSLLTENVVETILRAAAFAPLHNPPAVQGITAAKEVFGPSTPQVAVFDTAFHATMPPHAYMYGLPYEMYEKHAIRRYGFHGTSHQYLAQQAARMLGMAPQELNAISCHLGAGSSIAAIRNGRSVDTSMGMTPLEGLIMASRSGDLDPAVVLHLQGVLGLQPKDVDTLLNKKSGLLGLCGQSDVRGVLQLIKEGKPRGQLALDMLVYRIQKYIGAYTAVLANSGPVHALIFSAGIGENSALVRSLITDGIKPLGYEVDAAKNQGAVGVQADISPDHAKTRVLVIPTDEELGIAQQTASVVAQQHSGAAASA